MLPPAGHWGDYCTTTQDKSDMSPLHCGWTPGGQWSQWHEVGLNKATLRYQVIQSYCQRISEMLGGMARAVEGSDPRTNTDCRVMFCVEHTLIISLILSGCFCVCLPRSLNITCQMLIGHDCRLMWASANVAPSLIQFALIKAHAYVLLLALESHVSSSLQAKLHEMTCFILIGGQVMVCATLPEIPFPPNFSSYTNTLFVQLISIHLKIHHTGRGLNWV